MRRRVCVETPLRGEVERNVLYADMCMLDCIERGEAPFLGHLLYPRVLNDQVPELRTAGIAAHLSWLLVADAVVVYTDLGVTAGMSAALDLAAECRKPYEFRVLSGDWLERAERLAGTPGFLSRRN